jgi:hypothetical protein
MSHTITDVTRDRPVPCRRRRPPGAVAPCRCALHTWRPAVHAVLAFTTCECRRAVWHGTVRLRPVSRGAAVRTDACRRCAIEAGAMASPSCRSAALPPLHVLYTVQRYGAVRSYVQHPSATSTSSTSCPSSAYRRCLSPSDAADIGLETGRIVGGRGSMEARSPGLALWRMVASAVDEEQPLTLWRT